MIAFMGGLVVIVIYLAFSAVAVARFAQDGKLPDNLDEIGKYLVVGFGVFAPYIANKIASALE